MNSSTNQSIPITRFNCNLICCTFLSLSLSFLFAASECLSLVCFVCAAYAPFCWTRTRPQFMPTEIGVLRMWRINHHTTYDTSGVYVCLRVHIFTCTRYIADTSCTIQIHSQILATKSTENINNLNNEGYTPLHLSCQWDKPDCVKALLAAGADANIQSAKSRGPSGNNNSELLTHFFISFVLTD